MSRRRRADRHGAASRSRRGAASQGGRGARAAALLAAVVGVAGLLAGCGGPTRVGSAPVVSVVTGLWPLQQAVTQVGLGNVKVVDVVPAGVDPQTYALTPAQRAQVRGADVVVQDGGGFQPSFEAASAGARRVLDVASLAPAGDPYPWLDPHRMEAVASAVARTLTAADPKAAATFRTGLNAFEAQLGSIDGDYQSTLASCGSHTVVTATGTFDLLARRYPLKVVSLAGAGYPPLRPSQATVASQVAAIRSAGVNEILDQTWQPVGSIIAAAATAGAHIGMLDPLTGTPPGGWVHGPSYFDEMEANLGVLSGVLKCSASEG